MSIRRTVLSTHPLIRNTVLIVPLLLVVFLYFLREGIRIDTLKIGRFHAEGLYLKLDKKLIANIRYLTIPGNKTSLSSTQIETQLDRLKRLPAFFQSIALDDVVVAGRHYRILYQDHVIYLRNDRYEVAGMLERRGDEVYGSFPYLYLKQYGVQLKGTFRYNYRNETMRARGTYRLRDVAGNFSVTQVGKTMQFALNSGTFAHTHTLMDLPGMTDDVREWADRRVAAKRYQIVLLKGVLKETDGTYQLDPMRLAATFKLEAPVVRFNDQLKRIRAKKARVTIENNILYVATDHPTYAGKDLSGTRFRLTNLLGEQHSKIHIELKMKTPYDAVMAHVMHVYGVTLPLLQRSGTARHSVVLDVDAHTGATRFKGTARLEKGAIDLWGAPVRVLGGKVVYDAHRITLQAVDADWGWLHAKMNGTVQLDKKTATLSANIQRLRLGSEKSPFLHIKSQRKVPVSVQWRTQTIVQIPQFKTTITFKKSKKKTAKGFTVVCSDIRPFRPYLTGVPPWISGGTVTVKSPDGTHYRFSGKISWPSSYLYDKKGPITLFPFSGTFDGKTTRMNVLGGRIGYTSSNNLITLSHLYVDGKKATEQSQKKSSQSTHLIVKGSDSLIRYEQYVLLTDRFTLKINGKNTTFVATRDGDTVRTELNGNAIVVKANRIKAPMLRALIHFGGLQGGRYSLDLHGNTQGTMRGVITIDGGVASRFKTYNNLIALFNTVPALSTLSNPGFSKDGFEVRNGRIEFRIVKNRIFFDMIYIDGKSAAISGKGTVSTINGAIKMDLAVRTARGIGKLIGSLPIVGYILMGKDKSITTGVKVTGTLENPKVTTNVVAETLLAPFQMFVRTLKSPAHIINQ